MGWKVKLDELGNHKPFFNGWESFVEVDNFCFEDFLAYDGFERGRSSLNIRWKSMSTGKIYYSSMSMLDELLLSGKGVHRSTSRMFTVSRKFTFKKQGTVVLLTLSK